MSKRTIWALVAGVIALAIVLSAYGPQHEICEAAKPGQHNCASYGLPRYLLIEIGRFVEENSNLITALSGTAVAAFTGVLWWSTDKLWRLSKAELAHAEDTAKRELRAYVDFHNVGWDTHKTPDGGEETFPQLVVRIKNYGQTPADDVSLEMRLCIRVEGRGEVNLLKEEKVVEHYGGIAPSDHFTKRSRLPGLGTGWDLIGKNKAKFVCQLTITYVDVFKDRHTLESDFESVGHEKLFSVVLGTRKND